MTPAVAIANVRHGILSGGVCCAVCVSCCREELSIMVRLQHPHILRCYGGNLEGSNPFIVTELCECSLDKVGT